MTLNNPFIKVTQYAFNGYGYVDRKALVKCDNITQIFTHNEPYSAIITIGGDWISVKETVQEIEDKINKVYENSI